MKFRLRLWSLLAVLVLVGAACAGGDVEDEGGDGAEAEGGGGEITVAAVWTGGEQESFEAVIDAFTEESGVNVTYQSSDDLGTYLGTQIEGGNPPDVAMIPQPGLMRSLAEEGSLVELGDDATAALEENYAPVWQELGSVDGTPHGVYFKAASKATWWYNTAAFEAAGVQPPTTYDEMLDTAQTVNQSGTPFMAVGAADGWPLTDVFENLYLQIAGPDMYDQLANHEIKWTDDTVIETLDMMLDLLSEENLAGGISGTLETTFVDSVTQTYTDPPQSASVYEGDFVAGVISAETEATVGEEADFFPFPLINEGEAAVVGGGDVAVALTDSPEAQEFLSFIGTPEGAQIWAELGGFISPNSGVDPSVYPDEISQRIAQSLQDASDAGNFRFDMSDLQPADFGATAGRGMFQRFQELLRSGDSQATAKALEQDAAAAFGG
ncbi:MAG: ABC transporter substrate-binding protein [Actinomycetota bacterium]